MLLSTADLVNEGAASSSRLIDERKGSSSPTRIGPGPENEKSSGRLDDFMSLLSARRRALAEEGGNMELVESSRYNDPTKAIEPLMTRESAKADKSESGKQSSDQHWQRTLLIAEQRETIVTLRSEIDALRKSSAELEKRANDLRDKNVGMAKKLARRGIKADLEALLEEGDERPVNGGIDAYGRRITDLRAANYNLEKLLRSKDEDIERLDTARRLSRELISILREEASSLRREEKNNAAENAELREQLVKSERKNDATQRSLDHCLKQMDIVRAQLDELQTRNEEDKKDETIDDDEAELGRMRRLLEDRQASSRETVANLESKLREAKGEMRKFRTSFQLAAASSSGEASKRGGETGAPSPDTIMNAKIEEARKRGDDLEDENARLGELLAGELTAPREQRRGRRRRSRRRTATRPAAAAGGAFETWASSSWPAAAASTSPTTSIEEMDLDDEMLTPPLLLAMLQSSSSSLNLEYEADNVRRKQQ